MSIAKKSIGKKVIVRSSNEGINSGIVVDADETGIILKDARRLWYHKPENVELAFYEGVALSGLDASSKVSATVKEKGIIEDYSWTEVSDEAFASIMAITPKPCD